MSVMKLENGMRLTVESEMEQYRFDSFFNKEPETILWIEDCFDNGQVIYDIGANVGVYSLYSGMLYPGSTVYAFEPYLPNFNRLVENVNVNGLENVVPIFCALSDAPALEKLFVRDPQVGASGHQINAPVDEWGNPFEPQGVSHVLADSLDRVVGCYGLKPPQHIKIDVDGVEERIVAGMNAVIASERLLSVLIEVNHSSTDYGAIKRLFSENGFTVENKYNSSPDHSRFRRARTQYKDVENIVFTRP